MKKNVIFNSIYQLVYIATQLFIISYTSKVLGANGIGEYTLAYTYANYAILFGSLGFDKYASREIAHNQDDEDKTYIIVRDIFSLRVGTFLIVLLLYVFLFIFCGIDQSNSIKINIILILSFAVDISWFYTGLGKIDKIVVRNTLVRIATVFLLVLLVRDSEDVDEYTFTMCMSAIIGQIMLWSGVPIRKIFSVRNNEKKKIGRLKKHYHGALTLFIPTLAIQIYVMLDKIILGNVCGSYELGLYETSCKLVDITRVIQAAVTATTPAMTFLWARGKKDEYKKNIYNTFKYVSLCVFPLMMGLIAITPKLVPWFLGEDFLVIIPMMTVSALFILTKSWSSVMGDQVLMSSYNQKYYTIGVSVGAILDIVLNILLVKKYKSMGVLCASVLAEYVGMFIMLYAVIRKLDLQFKLLFEGVTKYAIISAFMGIVVFQFGRYLPNTFGGNAAQILMGGCIYCLALIITKDKAVRSIFKELPFIKKKK